jgi:hypothetical protein
MTDSTLSESVSSALHRATLILDDLHASNVAVASALAPLPLQDTLETKESRDRIVMAGIAVLRAVGLHVELAILLGKLEAAAGD